MCLHFQVLSPNLVSPSPSCTLVMPAPPHMLRMWYLRKAQWQTLLIVYKNPLLLGFISQSLLQSVWPYASVQPIGGKLKWCMPPTNSPYKNLPHVILFFPSSKWDGTWSSQANLEATRETLVPKVTVWRSAVCAHTHTSLSLTLSIRNILDYSEDKK
jgi:hypothetical protein